MGLFRLALQVCTIACVSIAIDGHVLLAVNVEDFRNLANRFLSKDLADKLTNLVSEISLGRMKENKQRVENELPDVDIIKEKHIKESARTNQYPTITIEAVTHNYKHKRFNTVKNSDSKELLRQAIYNTPPGPVYIRDEIDDLLLNINEGNSDNDNDRKKGYHPERLDDREYNIVSKQATRPFNLINISRDTHKEIDYTETKLGEWKYNHDITKEPPEIKNIKTGNADKDINDEGSTDYDKAKMHDLADNSGNEKNVQYVDETRLLGRKYLYDHIF
ncbi:uncharacterized protein LOC133532776 [Cydia pomonella]|uniref:uncharacterized protein LOC133532776 n=1 Tax=Cydia pomonella TaxID=82600 RepID=UPI002ADE60A5|nr:uncharacterized protein LOC133532776 [Cydia pomonella]